jgi:uncharacterized protein YcbX
MSECTVSALTIYPLKGSQGVPVETLEVRRGGIVRDREIMFAKDGENFAQRDHPEVARVRVNLLADGRIEMTAANGERFAHEVREEGDDVPIKILFNDIVTRDQGDEIAAWACRALGTEGIRVVSLPRAWDRWIPLPEFARIDGKPQHQLYDVAPVLLANQASLDDFNRRTPDPVPMDRFRANVVVEGLDAYAEDGVEALSSGSITLRFVTVCERCVMTTTDQDTGERRTKEPIKTLSTYRRRDEKYASGVVFGTYMTAERDGVLKLGDRLEVTPR